MLYYPSIDIIKKQKIQVMIPERITSGTAINKQPFNDAIFCGKLAKNMIPVLIFPVFHVSVQNIHFIIIISHCAYAIIPKLYSKEVLYGTVFDAPIA